MFFRLDNINFISKAIENKNGFGLLITFIFMVTLTVMVSSYISLVRTDLTSVRVRTDDVRAFYLAESGLNKAVWYLENTAPDSSTDGSWRTTAYPAGAGAGNNDPRQEFLVGGSYTMWVEDNDGDVQITAEGSMNNLQRLIRQNIEITTGSGGEVIVTSVPGSWKEI